VGVQREGASRRRPRSTTAAPNAEALQQVFADEFTALGGEIVAQEAVTKDQTDMSPALTKIAAAKPELLYSPVFVAAGGFHRPADARDPGLENVIRIGSDGMFTPDFVTAAGAGAEGFFLSSPNFSAFQARVCGLPHEARGQVRREAGQRVPCACL
jgi:ABC-type branched-subunit amino acid transport system substrate-binding protein